MCSRLLCRLDARVFHVKQFIVRSMLMGLRSKLSFSFAFSLSAFSFHFFFLVLLSILQRQFLVLLRPVHINGNIFFRMLVFLLSRYFEIGVEVYFTKLRDVFYLLVVFCKGIPCMRMWYILCCFVLNNFLKFNFLHVFRL